ncbi:MAG: hypothetical protein HC874_30375, partial [Richelia sp. SL_2_1]|nr:hypothetical protein [Richelia sp. SL_2_1]
EIHTYEQMAKMQAEIDGLKKQLTQVVAYIKQKLNNKSLNLKSIFNSEPG